MSTISHKRGDSFSLSGAIKDAQGVAVDLTGASLRCHLRQPDGVLIQALTCAITDAAAGTYSISATAAEAAVWPLGNAKFDVELTDAQGAVTSTDTVTLKVVEDITRDA